ncbi:hypothetical protein Tco_1010819, partial [Tanacetum coccineum]
MKIRLPPPAMLDPSQFVGDVEDVVDPED